jgi:hypothetical protein
MMRAILNRPLHARQEPATVSPWQEQLALDPKLPILSPKKLSALTSPPNISNFLQANLPLYTMRQQLWFEFDPDFPEGE